MSTTQPPAANQLELPVRCSEADRPLRARTVELQARRAEAGHPTEEVNGGHRGA